MPRGERGLTMGWTGIYPGEGWLVTPSHFMWGTQDYRLRAWIGYCSNTWTFPNYLQSLSLNNLNCGYNKVYELATQRCWCLPNLPLSIGNVWYKSWNFLWEVNYCSFKNKCLFPSIYIYIYIFYSFADFSMPSILIACDFVYNYVSLPFSEGEKY